MINKKDMIECWCQNLLCHRRPSWINKDEFNKNYRTMKCPDCGWVGFMPVWHVLTTDVLLDQVSSWRDVRLYRECFRGINYEKLPGTLDIQKLKKK